MRYNKEHDIHSLLVEKISGHINPEDDLIVQKAIENDLEVRALWQQIQRKHAEKGKKFQESLDEERAWERFRQRAGGGTATKRSAFSYKKWLSVAAAVVVLVSVSYYYWQAGQPDTKAVAVKQNNEPGVVLKLSDGRSIGLDQSANVDIGPAQLKIEKGSLNYTSEQASAEWTILSVPLTRDYHLVLSDGTEIWLNSSTDLRFPFRFTGDTREVYLKGEAYFKVAKDAGKPFIVHTGGPDIRVLGTSFNVNAYGTGVVTSLVEGSVENRVQDEFQLLTPGYQAVYDPDKGFVVERFNAETTLSWMDGIYYFDNAPLSDISDVLMRWFKIRLVIEDPGLHRLTFTGAIEKGRSPDIFIRNLETSAGIKATLRDDELHIR